MSRPRRRRPAAKAQTDQKYFAEVKADGTSPQTILEAVQMNTSNMPPLEFYYYLYQKSPWVAACVELIANAIAQDGFDVANANPQSAVDLAKDSRVGETHEYFAQAFVDMTFRDALYSVATDLGWSPCSYWRKKRVGRTMMFLERVDPRNVLPKPNAKRTAVEVFLVRTPTSEIDAAFGNSILGSATWQNAERVKPEDMVFFKRPGGDKVLGAPSKLEHLDHTLGLDINIRRFREAFFKNGGVSGKIFIGEKATKEQAQFLETNLRLAKRGADKAFLDTIVIGPWTVEDKGTTAGEQDYDFVKGSNLNREEVCAVYGVPVSKLTYNANSLGSSGKEVDDQTFQEQCVLPLQESIFEIITRDVLVAEWGWKDIAVVPNRRSELKFDKFGAANQGIQIGMTGNEARDLVGLPRIDNPLMDEPLFMSNKAPSLTSDMPEEPAAPPAAGDGGPANDAMSEEVAKPGAKGKRLRRLGL